MKKYLAIIKILLLSALIFYGCDVTKNEDEKSMEDLVSDPDFEFNTTRIVELQLNSYDKYDFLMPYAYFEIWKDNPDNGGTKKVLTARTDSDALFESQIVLPTYYEEVFLKSGSLVQNLQIIPEETTGGTIIDSFVRIPVISKKFDFTPQTESDNGYIFTLENMEDNCNGTTTITVRVQNDNNKALSHVAISLPAGVVPSEPDDGDTYIGEEGISYEIENPTNNPYYCIKYETIGEGIKNGADDIFIYIIPTDDADVMTEVTIHAKAANIHGEVTLDVDYIPSCNDSDGDGVPDDQDAYPNDPEKAFNDYTPSETEYGTFLYEDLWPCTGDYDMNDMVLDYQMIGVSNANYEIVEGIINLKLRASGASYNLGFAIQFPDNLIFSNIVDTLLNFAYMEPDGRTLRIFDNQRIQELFNVPSGEWINTDPDDPTYINPIEWTIRADIEEVKSNKVFMPPWEMPPFNPFIFVFNRDHEIHPPDYPYTSLMDTTLLDECDDATDPDQGIYFRTASYLPWVAIIAESMDYPKETIEIIDVFNHFEEWVLSDGYQYPDWYKDEPGYRNNSLIYTPPDK